jgi:hypothetical protein
MFDPLFGDIVSGAGEKVAAFVVKCLAVAGAFLVGYFLGGVIGWALDRWVFAQKAPEPVKKAIALVAGIALALLVALIVFGEGGSGLFGGGGTTGDGKGTPAPADTGKDKQPEPPKDVPKKNGETPPAPKPGPGDVRITILPDEEVKEGRFYQIEGDPVPKNLEEFKEEIMKKRKESKTELVIVFRFKKEPLSKNHTIVKNAVDWVNEVKLLNRFE